MRYLGIDYGLKRVGLALSDPMGIIAGPLTTLEFKDEKGLLSELTRIIKSSEAGQIIMGLPKNMDGTEGPMAKRTRDLGERLRELTGLPVVFKDERLSSVTANKALDEAGMHWSKRKGVVDTMAAQIILQSYLDGPKI